MSRTSSIQSKHKVRRRGETHGGAQAVSVQDLPAADELAHVASFDNVRVDENQREAYERVRAAVSKRMGETYATSLDLGCVIRLDRGYPLVACKNKTLRAEHSVGFAKGDAAEAGIMPSVGDWVAVAVPPHHDMGVIEAVMPRRNAFVRWRGGKRGEFQTLAANLDLVIVVAALGEEPVALGRIARSLVLARDCGVECAVVLTKADRSRTSSDLESEVARVQQLMGDSCQIVVSSSITGTGLEDVRNLVAPRTLAMILGESGAGKSTLINTLVGQDTLATGAVRERDDMGRHTTVARMMVQVPGAGVVCDAPGLRSLPLVGHEQGLARAFPEIAECAERCRFRDCTHVREPGCAVQEAHANKEIDTVRLEAYLALAKEMRESAKSLDPDIVI